MNFLSINNLALGGYTGVDIRHERRHLHMLIRGEVRAGRLTRGGGVEKGSRRFFTRWHEIAHVLTQYEQLQFPLHRSTVNKDPVERMMDMIAGDIGFLDELFTPILQAEIIGRERLTFAGVENVRGFFCPVASLEATLNACTNRVRYPLIVVQAALGFKKEEERTINSRQRDLLPRPMPEAKLRVISAVPNGAARMKRFSIPTRMRIPQGSIITQAFRASAEFESMTAEENLNWWRSSDGTGLSNAPVYVEALRVRDRVWAIMDLRR